MNIPVIDCGHGSMIDGKYQSIAKTAKSYRFPDGFQAFEGVTNRKIGSKLEHMLQLANIPFISLNTHDPSDMPLSERVSRINNWYSNNPNIWVLSIHSNKMNAAEEGESQSGRGNEIFYNEKGKVIADIAENVYKTYMPSFRWRGKFTANFTILTGVKCASVLTENLFYDNRKEAEYLNTDEGQTQIAKTLFHLCQKIIYLPLK